MAWRVSAPASNRSPTRSAAPPTGKPRPSPLTPRQAPEIWEKKPSYTEKVDVYAVGLIFWEIMQWSVEPYPYWNVPENDLVADGKHRR